MFHRTLAFALSPSLFLTVAAVAALACPACGGLPFTQAEEGAAESDADAGSPGSLLPSGNAPPPSSAEGGVVGTSFDAAVTKDAATSGDSAPSVDSAPIGDSSVDSSARDSETTDSALPHDSAPPPDDTCAVPHTDGVGQSWLSCIPAADATTLEACEAHALGVGGKIADCITEWAPPTTHGSCTLSTTIESGSVALTCYAPGTVCSDFCWGAGSAVYTCGCAASGTWN